MAIALMRPNENFSIMLLVISLIRNIYFYGYDFLKDKNENSLIHKYIRIYFHTGYIIYL